VGWPEPALVDERIESTRSCAASQLADRVQADLGRQFSCAHGDFLPARLPGVAAVYRS